ncbi:CB068 protein, partial [Leiothrix lutea]|nr:CB068 protein [Leiothrix lutea]
GMEAAATTAAPGWRCRPGGRLDMSHGFVRHIRRNQLARGELAWGPPAASPKGAGAAGGPGGDASVGPPPDTREASPDPARGPRLFCLEYEGDDGQVTAVIVHQGDSAEEVTRRVCARSPLEPPLRRALCQRVQDELSKRRGTG